LLLTFNSIMSVEYKPKNELLDLYHILGLTVDVCKEEKCDELIKAAYVKKARQCHPDKNKGRADMKELFELITGAYDILKDKKQREEYNHKLSLEKQSSNDFHKLKKGAEEYMESLGEYKEPSGAQKISFKEQMLALDSKHGFVADEMNPINSKLAKKKFTDLAAQRSAQDRDLLPEKLFADGKIDLKKFNAAFDLVHKKPEDSMIPHNGIPSAWNDMGTVASYSNFDNLDNLYVEDSNRFDTARQNYSSLDFGSTYKPITKDQIKGLSGADYVTGHNNIDDNYYADMKSKLAERKSMSTQFDNLKYNDFKRDDTAGYGIFDQLGFKFDDRLTLDVEDDDISKKFEKLMAERNAERNSPILPGVAPPPPIATKKKLVKDSR